MKKSWFNPGLEKLIDEDILKSAEKAKLTDTEVCTLQLCREIKNLAEVMKPKEVAEWKCHCDKDGCDRSLCLCECHKEPQKEKCTCIIDFCAFHSSKDEGWNKPLCRATEEDARMLISAYHHCNIIEHENSKECCKPQSTDCSEKPFGEHTIQKAIEDEAGCYHECACGEKCTLMGECPTCKCQDKKQEGGARLCSKCDKFITPNMIHPCKQEDPECHEEDKSGKIRRIEFCPTCNSMYAGKPLFEPSDEEKEFRKDLLNLLDEELTKIPTPPKGKKILSGLGLISIELLRKKYLPKGL